MKRRLFLASIAVSALNVSIATTANSATISISPLYSNVDNGNSGGGSGTNLIVGTNCELKPFCQTGWWNLP